MTSDVDHIWGIADDVLCDLFKARQVPFRFRNQLHTLSRADAIGTLINQISRSEH